MNPTSWTALDVENWARQVGLSDAASSTLRENEVDGATLVTMEREELRSELGIVSLPARRYLWDLILSLRSYQGSSDRTVAIDILEQEIEALPTQGVADASAGGSIGTDEEVVNQLRSDAAEQVSENKQGLEGIQVQRPQSETANSIKQVTTKSN